MNQHKADPDRVADRRGKPKPLAPFPPSRRAKAPLRRDGGQGAERFASGPGYHSLRSLNPRLMSGTPPAFFYPPHHGRAYPQPEPISSHDRPVAAATRRRNSSSPTLR